MIVRELKVDDVLWGEGVAELSAEDSARLERIRAALRLMADVSRSDVLLIFVREPQQLLVAAHAPPLSMATLFTESQAGLVLPAAERRWLWNAITSGQRQRRVVAEEQEVHPEVEQQVLPCLGASGRPMAAVLVLTNAIERERHRRREPAYQRALARFQEMAAEGLVAAPDDLPAFREQDGVLFVDYAGRYRYLSGQASNVYRRMGYLDDLRGRSMDEVGARDSVLVRQAWESAMCQFSEDTVRERILVRTAIPLLGQPDYEPWHRRLLSPLSDERYGALLLVKDVTEPRLKAKELRVKAIMLKEVHHRVKNNLQMLVSIMRMQARRTTNEEARHLLLESAHRILSMSIVHESLSEGSDQSLNLRDLVMRIASQVQQSMTRPGFSLHVDVVRADDITLRTNKATAVALVTNELLLNAIEHGFAERKSGRVWVNMYDEGENVTLTVSDDGKGLPPGFSIDSSPNLGLDIICTLVQDDLRGTFELDNRPEGGAQALVRFPKGPLGGTE